MGRTEGSTGVVVCDAGPVIHLDELNCLSLLGAFEEIVIPPAVYEEILLHREKCLAVTNVHFVKTSARLPLDERLLTMCQVFSLHAGEIEALAEMETNPDALFLTDDCAARLVAERMGYRVHGTIGIIVRSMRWGQMPPSQAIDVLTNIPIRSSLHLRPSLLREIIQKVKDETRHS